MVLKLAPAVVLALAALTIPVAGQRVASQSDFEEMLRRAGGRTGAPAARTSVIRGRVLAGDTGVALRRALVSAQGGGRPVVAQTDFDGRFELEVPPGRWTVTAAKAGFVTLRLGQRRAFESVPPIEIDAGQRMENADFILPRGGAISGRVFDELGDPVLDARVRVLRYRMVRGRKQLSSAGIAVTTDDRGVYRLYGLPPGQYYVSARAETRPLDRGDVPLKYATTYYPGTADITDAQRVLVDVGDEQDNVNFLLLPMRTARVSGTVVDVSGAPLAGGTVTLAVPFEASANDVTLGASGPIAEDGSFTLNEVIPGSYTLMARSRRARRLDSAEPATMAYVPLVVPGDLTDVTVTAATGAIISGTIENAGDEEPPRRGIRVLAEPLGATPAVGALISRALDDGAFTIEGVIGPTTLRVGQLPPGWMLERVEVNGMDVTDTFLDFAGAERALARIVVTNRIPEVSGRVATERQAPSGHHVVLFPADSARWTFPSRYVHAIRTEPDGRFRVRGIPPYDRYLAVAVDYLEEDEATDPDFLQAIRGAATSFGVRAGEARVLELKLVER